MNISVEELEEAAKGLPIGFYIGAHVPVAVSQYIDVSYCDVANREIKLSLQQMNLALSCVQDADAKSSTIRAMLYHEVSHAFLTPSCMYPRKYINIFEDERIETICRTLYKKVCFKKLLKQTNHWVGPTDPRTTEDMFFQIVRFHVCGGALADEFGLDSEKFLPMVKELIIRYAGLKRDSKVSIVKEYVNDVFDLWLAVDNEFGSWMSKIPDQYKESYSKLKSPEEIKQIREEEKRKAEEEQRQKEEAEKQKKAEEEQKNCKQKPQSQDASDEEESNEDASESQQSDGSSKQEQGQGNESSKEEEQQSQSDESEDAESEDAESSESSESSNSKEEDDETEKPDDEKPEQSKDSEDAEEPEDQDEDTEEQSKGKDDDESDDEDESDEDEHDEGSNDDSNDDQQDVDVSTDGDQQSDEDDESEEAQSEGNDNADGHSTYGTGESKKVEGDDKDTSGSASEDEASGYGDGDGSGEEEEEADDANPLMSDVDMIGVKLASDFKSTLKGTFGELLDMHAKLNALLVQKAKMSKMNGAAINAYSGILDPRSIGRSDWRVFVKKNRLGNVRRFSKIKLNLFIDCSGSFYSNVYNVNKMLGVLEQIEQEDKDFSFDVIRLSQGEYLCPKEGRRIWANGGTEFDNQMSDIYAKVNDKDATCYNVLLVDGPDAGLWGGCWHTGISSRTNIRCDRAYACFNKHTDAIITDSSNAARIKLQAPNANMISMSSDKKYVQELQKNVIDALSRAIL